MPKKKKIDDKDRPWVSNYPPLDEWLKKIEARCHDQTPVGSPKKPEAYYETWWVPSTQGVFVIMVRSRQRGWDIYTPIPNTIAIDETLNDAEKRLGLAK